MSYGSAGIAHLPSGLCVFVEGGMWGDVCTIEITSLSKHFAQARLVSLIEPSELRCEPAFSDSVLAGGAPWSHLMYEAQLSAKQSIVADALSRVAHLSQDTIQTLLKPIIPAKKQWGYRNKIELSTYTNNGTLCIGMFDVQTKRFVPVSQCPLGNDMIVKAAKAAQGALQFVARSQDIGLERVGIRASVRTRSLEVALWTKASSFPRSYVANMLNSAIPEATSVVRVLTKGQRRVRKVVGVERLSGEGSWREQLAGRTMRISAPSFFQVHTRAAETLISCVLDALCVKPTEKAFDLYCGAGTFTLPLADACMSVVGVEAQGTSINDLKRYIERESYTNITAVCGDSFREFPHTDADVIVVDPPRAGLAPEVIAKLNAQKARAIAYVSCDPITLARDIQRFCAAGVYTPVSIVPVDVFPQSFHVECVTLLERVN